IQDLACSLEAEQLEKNNLQQRIRELEDLQASTAADRFQISEETALAAEGAVVDDPDDSRHHKSHSPELRSHITNTMFIKSEVIILCVDVRVLNNCRRVKCSTRISTVETLPLRE
ncbi:hypothetical protein AVEN_6931-1, partial [Araneus ventricosus]